MLQIYFICFQLLNVSAVQSSIFLFLVVSGDWKHQSLCFYTFCSHKYQDVMAKLGHIERIVVFRPKQLKNNFEVFEVIYSE